MRVSFFIIGFLLFINNSFAQQNSPDCYIFSDSSSYTYLGKYLYLFHDSSDALTFSEIQNKSFVKGDESIPHLKVNECYWIRFSVKNQSSEDKLFLVLKNPGMDKVEFFYRDNNTWHSEKTGDAYAFNTRKYSNQNFIFDLNVLPNEQQEYYLRVKSSDKVLLPIVINYPEKVYDMLLKQDLWVGIFIGVLLVIFIYNLFLFTLIKEKVYLFYICYILSIGLTQTTILGYTFRFLTPQHPGIFDYSLIVFLVDLSGLFIILFFNSFIPDVKKMRSYKWFVRFYILAFGFLITALLSGLEEWAYTLADVTSFLFGIYFITILFILSKKGNRQAKFLFAGWLVALIGFALFSLRNMGILPYNFFTNSTMQIGVSIETIIFSFALADRINILKKENDRKQEEIIRHLHENEKYLLAVKDSELMVERLKKESIVSQFESLKSQVNPHFLFNSLNVLLELIYQNQDKAVKFVRELSDVYRYVLDSKRKELVELVSEFEFIQAFSYLLKIRYPDNLHITISLHSLHSASLPPLAIQLLLENAIKHNVISKSHPLTIEIVEESNYVVVRNNLQIKNGVQKSSGIGLQNLNARYEYLTDKKVIVLNDGYFFIVKLPLIQKENNK